MAPKQQPQSFTAEDKKTLLAVHRILRYKRLHATANRLLQEAHLTEPAGDASTSANAREEWNRLAEFAQLGGHESSSSSSEDEEEAEHIQSLEAGAENGDSDSSSDSNPSSESESASEDVSEDQSSEDEASEEEPSSETSSDSENDEDGSTSETSTAGSESNANPAAGRAKRAHLGKRKRSSSSSSSSSSSTSSSSSSEEFDSSSESDDSEGESESESGSSSYSPQRESQFLNRRSSDSDSDASSEEEKPPKKIQKTSQNTAHEQLKDTSPSLSRTLSPPVVARTIRAESPTQSKSTYSLPRITLSFSSPAGSIGVQKPQRTYFSRIKNDIRVHPGLVSNEYNAGADNYGARANRDLIVTKGDGFRKEKQKKKRGSYRGGTIDFQTRSFKFDD